MHVFFFFRKMMDKQTFSSIQATTNTSRYAAAVFRKGLTCLCQHLVGVSVGLIVLLTLIKTQRSHMLKEPVSVLCLLFVLKMTKSAFIIG